MAEGTAWSVTAQREDTDIGPDGTYVRGMTVTFTTAAGNKGTVFVPLTDYSVPRVQALVSQQAARMDAVGNLSGGG